MSEQPPVLGSDVSSLTNEQIVAWYAHHPHPTVKALVGRIRLMEEQHQQQNSANHAYAKHMMSRLSPEELGYLEPV